MNKFGRALSEGPIRSVKSMITDRIVHRIDLKQAFSLWKGIKCFVSTLRWRNVKTQQLQFILDLCFSKARSGKYHNYRRHRFRKAYFSKWLMSTLKCKAKFLNFSGLKSGLEKFRLCDGLVWTVDITAETRFKCVSNAFSNFSRVVRTGPKSTNQMV